MTPDEDLTIEQELAAALEAHKAAEAEALPEIPEETPASDGPTRGPDGKFVAKADNSGEAENGSENTPAELSAPETPVIPDKFALPPAYAKAGIKAKWAELPAEVRQELHEREGDFHKQLTRQDEERNFGKQIKQVVAPYEGFLKSLNANPVQAFDYLIKTDYALRTAPPEQRKAMFIKAAADYGIQFGEGELSGQPAPAVDPRLETLQQRLDRLESERNNAMQAQQLAEQRSIEQQIADFASRPENVFFDRLQPLMGAFLESGQADSLEKAYEMAVYADPETRALQLAAQGQQSQRSTNELKRAEAERAKRASVSVTGAPGPAVPSSSPTNANATLEEDIRAAIAAAGRI